MTYQIFVETAPIPVGGAGASWVDVSAYTMDGTVDVQYGRQTVDQRVDPSTCSIEVLLDSSLGEFPIASFDLGRLLRVRATIDGYVPDRIRFIGVVTDISITKETMVVTAVSQLISRYGKYALPNPVTLNDTAGYICADIANEALPGIPNYVVGPMANYWAEGIFQLDADFPAGTNALEALYLTAESEPFGFIYEDFSKEGMISTDQNSRNKISPDFVLSGSEILDDWEVSKSVTSQLTKAIVNYVGGNQTEFDIPDVLGELEKTYDTIIITLADANQFAQWSAERGTNLRYEIPKITIPFAVLSSARQNQFMSMVFPFGIQIGSMIEIPTIRSYIQNRYFVEGWNEVISRHRWDWTLYLSDVRRTRYYQKWNNVTSTLTWDTTPASITWNDLEMDWI